MESKIVSLLRNVRAPAFRWGRFLSGRVILPVFLICLSFSLIAQERAYDLLVKKDGTILEVVIAEDRPDEILYRKKDAPDGPIYAILKSELLSAKYRNGETATFTITIDNFYEGKEAGAAPPPFEKPVYQPLPPKNEFQKQVLALETDRLEHNYKLYRAASKSAKAIGFWGVAIQVGMNLAGTFIIAANVENVNGVGRITNEGAVRAGRMLIIAGTLGGTVMGISGFVRAAKNGNKAKYIRSEMRRRGLPPPAVR